MADVVRSDDPAPPAARAAQDAGLGGLLASARQEPRVGTHVAAGIMYMALSTLPAVLLGALFGSAPGVVAVLVAGTLGLTGVCWLCTPAATAVTVHVHELGAVVVDAGAPDRVRTSTGLVPYELGGAGPADDALVLRDERRQVVQILSGAAAAALATAFAQAETPRATDALELHRAVRYGPVLLRGDAVAFGGVRLPWSRVERISTSPTRLELRARGVDRPVATVRRDEVPHQRTVLAVADRMTDRPT
jgi:hypothetical protein